MEEKVVYKRNSVWWIATCYFFGTLFLLLYAVASILGMVADVGIEGFVAIKDSIEHQEAQKIASSTLKNQVQLRGYNAQTENGKVTLAVSLQNTSEYPVESVRIEVAELDKLGVPVKTMDRPLDQLGTVYPGDTAHSHIEFDADPQNAAVDYSVRISDFRALGEGVIQQVCDSIES